MKSNSLKHKIIQNDKKGNFNISIRLSDDSKGHNGHQDFAITASFWEIGQPRIDKYMITAGCCHDEILKHHPELKTFVNLHLCDYNGAHMHCTANGFYHLKGKSNNNTMSKDAFCEYYRINARQYDDLIKAESEGHFTILLKALEIPNQWKGEAKEGIKLLEGLTGKEFLNDSIKSNFHELDKSIEADIKAKIKEGHYSDDKIQARETTKKEEAGQKKINDLKETAKKDIEKINIELDISLFLIEKSIQLDSVIYYSHTNTIKFNWMKDSYRKEYTDKEFKTFCDGLSQPDFNRLPNGITFELNGITKFSN